MNAWPYTAWRYESDGEIGQRTHYAVRYTEEGDEERIDFPDARKARAFVADSNAIIIRTLNQ